MADHRIRALAAVADRMRAEVGDHPAAQRMLAEANKLAQNAEALDNINARRRPSETEAAHVLRVAERARAFDREITAGIQRMGRAFAEGMQDVQQRIDSATNLKPNAFAGEIRAAFRELSGKARDKQVTEWMEAGAGAELAAILRAPGLLTGLSDAQRSAYERSYTAKHAGEELDEQAMLESAFNSFTTIQQTAGAFAASLLDPHKLAEIEKGEADARAADQAFKQSLDGSA